MSDGLEMTVTGLPQFDSMMLELASGNELELAARKAMRAGGDVIKAAIAAHAPVRVDLPSGTALPPGALQSDIQVNVGKEKDGSISAYIEPGKSTFRVAMWVEWGHRLVEGGRFANWGKRGKGRVTGDVPAHPYIRPAFEANQGLAAAAIDETLSAEITALGKRLGG